MRKHALIFFSLAFILALSACSQLRLDQDSLPWNKDKQVLYQDDFTNEESGWESISNVYELKGYSSAGYLISVNLPNSRSWSTSGYLYKNPKVSVEVRKITGPADTNYGLVCRYLDPDNYYSFLISPDGYYAIMKKQNGSTSILGAKQFTHSDAIQKDDGLNELTATCDGENLILAVNGSELMTVQDSTFQRGEVGVILETRAQDGASSLFMNFEVSRP
ncbi:MAG TPA: hypothetical protein PLN80_01970 [Anaerolineaceae bacterium]|jgi:hypothetical protein|nr:hypothetical protein [Anaerolineaceae bacterium]